MKTLHISLVLMAAFFLASCGNNGSTDQGATTTEPGTSTADASDNNAKAVTYTINPENSTVRWEGNVTGVKAYGHYGTIKIKEGTVTMKNDKVVDGNIVIDMNSINPQDSNFSDENPPSKLVGHLSTGDFFLTEEYPTATFSVSNPGTNEVGGKLSIRGNTNTESITLSNVETNSNSMKAKGELVFNRQDYQVNWKHYLKDAVLANDITLNFEIEANK